MTLSDLIDALQELEEEGLGDCQVLALVEGRPPASLSHVEPETHEGSGATTIWLRAEEV